MKSELGVILAIVLFGLLSILFGVMAYFASVDLYGAKPEDSKDERIKEIDRKIGDLKDEIETYRGKFAAKSELLSKYRDEFEALSAEKRAYENQYTLRLANKKSGEVFGQQATEVSTKVTELKSKTLAAINKDISLIRETTDKNVEAKNKEKTDTQARVLKMKGDYETKVKSHRADMNYQKSQLGDTKQVLQDLTQREPVRANILDRVDGKVILSDPLRNFVAIDVGTGSGVKNGFRFEVYVLRPGNKHVTKAYIEVVKAGPTQSECSVIRKPIDLPMDQSGYVASQPEEIFSPNEQSGKKGASAEIMTGSKTVMMGQDMRDPIVEGNLIQNPFFDATRQLTYYIAGSKEMTGERQKSAIRYTWREIKDAAERHGAKVAGQVDTNVNYIIAQKNPGDDPEYKKAVDLGIPIIYEWELFRFLDNK